MLIPIVAAVLMLAPGTTNSSPDALAAARAWVSLLDAKKYDESWSEAGTILKAQMPKARWALTVQPARQPLGAVLSRSVSMVTRRNTLPGAPDGDFQIFEFATKFAAKANAIETVVLAREGSNWKVDGYFVR